MGFPNEYWKETPRTRGNTKLASCVYWPELLSRNTAAPCPQWAVGPSSTLCWWPWKVLRQPRCYTQWRRPDLPWEGNNHSLLCSCPVWSQRCYFTTKAKRKEEWPHPTTAESTKGMKPLGTSSAALGNSLPRPCWRHDQYFQPTKQSSVWGFLSMFTPLPHPVWPSAHSPSAAFPWQWHTWTIYNVQCTSQGSSPTLSYPGTAHLCCLFPHVTEFAPAGFLPQYSSESLLW